MALPHVQVGCTADSSTFKNFFQNFGSMQSLSNPSWPGNMNRLNMPNGVPAQTIFGNGQIPSSLTSSDVLVLAWKGTATHAGAGAIQLARGSPGFTVSSDPGGVVIGATNLNLTVEGTNGYVEFSFAGSNPTTLTLNFFGGSTFSNMTQLIFCRKTDYATVSAPSTPDQMLSDDWINAWKAFNPSAIRMLGTFCVNTCNTLTQWRYRPDWANCIFLAGKHWEPTVWAGNTSGTNAYTIGGATDTPAAYTDGEVISCCFVNASNATPITVNVAGRGAVPMFDRFAGALTSTGVSTNTLYTMVYNRILGGYLCYSGSQNGNSSQAHAGIGDIVFNIPIEVLVAFCNRVGCKMWLNLPLSITTANTTMEATNSVTQLVQYCSNNLQRGLNLEYCNEQWNFFGVIGQNTSVAAACGTALGFPGDNNRPIFGYYASKVCTVAALARAAWSNPAPLQMVMALQGAGPTAANNTYRLQGSDLVANGALKSNTLSPVISVASPAVVTWTAHGLQANWQVSFTGAGLPTGITAGTPYYVLNPGSNSFNISVSPGGAAINTTGTSTGSQTVTYTNTFYGTFYSSNFNTFGSRPIDVCDVLAYGTYWYGNQCQQFDSNYAPPNGVGPSITITGISTSTAGQPGVITLGSPPGYPDGQRATLAGITQTGTPVLNGMNVTLHLLTSTTYSMYSDAAMTTPVDTSAFTYTSGGTTRTYPSISTLTGWADLYATAIAAGNAANVASVLSSFDTDVQGTGPADGQTTAQFAGTIYPNWETIAAGYDGARPGGRSNLTIELYEGAYAGTTPSTGTCTTLGIPTSYSASIANLISGYKLSKYFYNRAYTALSQFTATSAPSGRSIVGVWFLFTPVTQWSMSGGSDIYGTPFYQSYYLAKNVNSGKRRLFWVG